MSIPPWAKTVAALVIAVFFAGGLLGVVVAPVVTPTLATLGQRWNFFAPKLELDSRSAGLLTREMTLEASESENGFQGFLGVYVIAAHNSGRSPSDEKRVCFSADGYRFHVWDITRGHGLSIGHSERGYVVTIPPVSEKRSHEVAIFTLSDQKRTTDSKPVVECCS